MSDFRPPLSLKKNWKVNIYDRFKTLIQLPIPSNLLANRKSQLVATANQICRRSLNSITTIQIINLTFPSSEKMRQVTRAKNCDYGMGHMMVQSTLYQILEMRKKGKTIEEPGQWPLPSLLSPSPRYWIVEIYSRARRSYTDHRPSGLILLPSLPLQVVFYRRRICLGVSWAWSEIPLRIDWLRGSALRCIIGGQRHIYPISHVGMSSYVRTVKWAVLSREKSFLFDCVWFEVRLAF